ncbi:MAG TPA: chorismate mutase, partial [bacterium]|nr:chorismate mutase [bacterium]
QSPLRNEPYWHLVIELRRRIPRIPLICDPSHIAGRRDMIPELAQHAMRLDYQGLMVESHRRPEEALSDAKQQLTFDELKSLLGSLVVLHSDIEDRDVKLKIQELRSEIDQLDLALIRNLGKRMAVARRIGALKKEHSIALFQSERWSEIVDRSHERARREQLDEGFIDDIFQTIHQESIREQERS